MSSRRPLSLLAVGALALSLSFVWWLVPRVASAQCGGEAPKSVCYTCHAQTNPVCSSGQWHVDHAGQDMCWNCHGGNNQATDKNLAHVSLMRNPLQDIYTSCYACHPSDYRGLADRYAVILGVTPGSPATPTPRPTVTAQRVGVLLPAAGTIQPPDLNVPPEFWPLALALLVLLSAFLLERGHARR